MRTLIQRVSRASVDIKNETVGEITAGLVALIGIKEGDDAHVAQQMVDKIVNLRIFEDDQGKMNLSALQVDAQILAISQFTLYADCSRGRRPSFVQAALPDVSKPLYQQMIAMLKSTGLMIQHGVFGAEMAVYIVNSGPVTIMLDSDDWRKRK
jgi:D-tyrosyl-tRNA(Tyr) deacylase